jgi:competence protein ComEC
LTLVYLGGAWLLGLVAASLATQTPWPLALLGPGLGIAAAFSTRRWAPLALGLVAGLLIVGGMWRYEQARPLSEPGGIAAFNDGPAVRFRALVSDEPDERGQSARIRLSAREVWVDGAWEETSGGVLLRRDPLPRYRYGDLLEVEGKLETPPVLEDFNYRDYLARQGIASLADYPRVSLLESGRGNPLLEVVHGVRRRLSDALAVSLPDPEASLAQGILLGSRSALGPSLTEALNATSLSHLIAISGYNVTVVAGLVIGSLAWLLGRRKAALAALLAIAAYTILTGASPSVVRAAIMGGLFLIATLVGRPGSALTAIVLAAALMTAHRPLVVHDVSFQLSFAAIVGLVYLSPAIQVRIRQALSPLVRPPEVLQRGIAGMTVENLAVTLAAIAATLPIIALNFQRISLVAPLANLLVLPAFPPMLLLSGLDAAAGAVWGPLGDIAAWAAWPLLAYLVAVASHLADLPLAALEVPGFGMGHAVLLYAAIGLLAWWMQPTRPGQALLVRAFSLTASPARRATAPLRLVPTPWLAGSLALAAGLLWWAALTPSSDRLTVTVMDVGQGDAILIEDPAGHRILVDGGPSSRAISEALGRETSFWDKRVDLVVLTHPEEDHLNGLVTVLERYDVKRILVSPIESDSAAYDAWRQAAEHEGGPYYEAAPGEWFDLGRGARLEVLGPPSDPIEDGEAKLNNNSVLLRLTWGGVSFLLTGDLERAGEEALLSEGRNLRSTVLKVAHHGGADATSVSLLAAVHPAVAVISVGKDNWFGHPSPQVLERLGDNLVYRTDLNGRVKLSTDGERLWVEVERTPTATPAEPRGQGRSPDDASLVASGQAH